MTAAGGCGLLTIVLPLATKGALTFLSLHVVQVMELGPDAMQGLREFSMVRAETVRIVKLIIMAGVAIAQKAGLGYPVCM